MEANIALSREDSEERARKQSYFCFIIGIVTLGLAKFEDCSALREAGVEPHLFDMKSWMMVYLCISFTQIFRSSINANLDSRFEAQEITFRQRRNLRICLFLSSEMVNCGWQIYGNLIFWHNKDDAEH